MSWDSTARLLRRTGFGANGGAVDQASRVAPAELVARMLAARPADDPGARRTPVPHPAMIAPRGKQRSQDERRQFRKQLQQDFKSVVA
jgi:hypothetical protein